MRVIRFFTFIFGIIAIIVTVVTLWIPKTFGNEVHFEQIIWHLMESTLEGVDSFYIIRAIKFSVFTLFLIFIWIVIVYPRPFLIRGEKFSFIKRILSKTYFENKKWSMAIFLASFLYLLAVGMITDKKFQISEYLTGCAQRIGETGAREDPLKENYMVPVKDEIYFAQKKNMVLILAESMEYSFNDPALPQTYIPHMAGLQSSSQYAEKFIDVVGTNWTIAGVTGWFFGLPLKLPKGIHRNRYVSKKGFLPGAESIFDILRENGYELAFILGTSKVYSGKDILFSGHGSFTIRDREYFKNQGWSLEEYGGTQWGYNDAFVFARALEEYKKLAASGKPFVLLVETVDTHGPDGFCPPERRTYNDIRDAIVELDRNLAAFVREIWNDDTIVIILGDHLFMGEPEFLAPVRQRHVFNLFHGDLPPVPAKKRAAYVSALDMAPTLLQAAGARWGHDRFGLGVSLFSEEPTLLEVNGPQKFNRILSGWSPFYSSLYEKKSDVPPAASEAGD